jgi:hypothetical protein
MALLARISAPKAERPEESAGKQGFQMPPTRIMVIRHAEKPDPANHGVAGDGTADEESLTVRGWQRAGALVTFFTARADMRPSVIFAAGIAHGSKSKRPAETVTPLVAKLKEDRQAALITDHPKDGLQPLVEDVLSQQGTILISWEHQRIPDVVRLLPNPPSCPHVWPDDRFDLVWVFDYDDQGWRFTQVPQLLLAGDRADPIV